MSKAYREKFGNKKVTREEIRKFCQPEINLQPDGVTPVYVTEQEHQKECDVNEIIKKYQREKVIEHVSHFNAFYGDMSGDDFRSSIEKMQNCRNHFQELPSEIRRRFDNSPEHLLRFMENPQNREEGIRIGLIRNDSDPSSDGFGEHVKLTPKTDQVQPGAINSTPGGTSIDPKAAKP